MQSFQLFVQKNFQPEKMAAKNGRVYEFAEFRLIPDEGLLLRNGKPVQLSIKAFSALVLLVERHGHLVLKSELIESVWADVFVEEAVLSKCVWSIRNALGEDSKNSTFIQTMPKRGYRFIAPVRVVNDGSGAFRLVEPRKHAESDAVFAREHQPITNGAAGGVSVSTDVAATYLPAAGRVEDVGKTSRLMSYRWATRAALAAIVIVTAGYFGFVRQSSGVSPRSIAVLPIAPINTPERNSLYELGITDSLILRLSSAEGLVVRPLSAVRDYDGATKDPIAVGREQRADYVLVSNYQVADGRIKVTAQLYNVGSGTVEEPFQLQKTATDLFATQDAIAADLGNRLMRRLGVISTRPIKTVGTENEEAYRLYLHGRQLFLHNMSTFTEGASSVENLKQAVALDPEFARAWAALATAYVSMSTGEKADGSERRSATEAVNKAIAIDPNLAEAHAAKCFAATILEFDLGTAESACKRALELDPNSGEAHAHLAKVFSALRRNEQAVSEIKTAIELEPTSARYQRWLGNALYFARRLDEAAAQYKRCIDLNPSDPNNYESLARTLEAQQRGPDAFEPLIRSMTLRGADSAVLEKLRTAYNESGWQGVLHQRIRTSKSDFGIAAMYVQLGDKDLAFEWLEKAYARHAFALTFLETDPQFDLLHDDPRFRDLIRRIRAN